MKNRPHRLTPPKPARMPLWRHPLFITGLVLTVTFAVHFPLLRAGFLLYDDTAYVTDNPVIRTITPGSLGTVFTSFYQGNYQPLTMVSYMLEYRAFGNDPRGYHLVGILLHLAATGFVFAFARTMTRSAGTAAAIALVFGIHPIHVESVAWISERKDLLYSVFYLGSLLFYTRYVADTSRFSFYGASTILFIFSLLSKAMAVTLPVAMLLIDLYTGRAMTRRIFLEKLPLLAIAALVGVVAIIAQRSGGAAVNLASFGSLERLMLVGYALFHYAWNYFVPIHLSPFYPYPYRPGAPVPGFFWLFAPLVLAWLGGLAYLIRRKPRSLVTFGLTLGSLTLLPVLQILPIGTAIIADRYMYLPALGVLFMLAGIIRAAYIQKGTPFARSWVARAAAVPVLAGLGFLTWTQSAVWTDDVSLWTRVIERSPQHPEAYFSRGTALGLAGHSEPALADFDAAIALAPDYVAAHLNRANALLSLGRRREAITGFTQAIVINPDRAELFLNRGMLYRTEGVMDSALADFERAAILAPRNPTAHWERGTVFAARGDLEKALEAFSRFIELSPESPDGFYNRAIIKGKLGRQMEACGDLRHAARLGFPPAQELLARVCR